MLQFFTRATLCRVSCGGKTRSVASARYHFMRVSRGVGDAGSDKSFASQPTGVTTATGPSFGVGLVAAHGLHIIDPKRRTALNNLRFGQVLQGRMDLKFYAFNARARSQIGHVLESGDKFGAAIRVTGIINRIDANEDVARTQHFGQSGYTLGR